MPVFELLNPTEARLASVTPRVERHGDDDVPAVSISVEIETANTVLDLIDPTIREALYKAKPDATPPNRSPSTSGTSGKAVCKAR